VNAYDLDGTLTAGIKPKEPYVIISGRTWSEWDSSVNYGVPVAIRGTGRVGDWRAAVEFKVTMIYLWDILNYYEDDPRQAERLQNMCSECVIHLVKP
jgi:hypothetical protein